MNILGVDIVGIGRLLNEWQYVKKKKNYMMSSSRHITMNF